MDTNLTAHYMATQTSRSQLDARAAQGWHIEQGLNTEPGPADTVLVRQRIGAVLIRAGERLQGLPRPAITAVSADHAPASARTS